MPRTPSAEREALRDQAAAEYDAGDSIRGLMTRHHMSYGAMHFLFRGAGVTFRPRGGARVGPRKAR